MVHAPGLLRIGRAAYFVWAYPPKRGWTAQRHVQAAASSPGKSTPNGRDYLFRKSPKRAFRHARGKAPL